jgi:NAD(P)-dependent dehydrogenase (short-subunit alcohol dehydrogenase family)
VKALVITGAAGAIGSATAHACCRQDRRLYLFDINKEGLNTLQKQIQDKGGTAIIGSCDVSDPTQVNSTFAGILDAQDEIEGIIHSAAVMDGRAHFLDLAFEEWNRTLDMNLRSVFLCTQAAARQMKAHGGSIVNVGSLSSRRAHREQASYDAAKGGLEALTRAMALDLAPYAIRVNAVLPIAIETATMLHHDEADYARKKRFVPLGRYGRPEEVAEVCKFLIDHGTYITGQCIVVDGGIDCQLRPIDIEYLESDHFKQTHTP